ncbi:MAG TPA: serine hydrolase domain-containing protein [Candidatus Baltobacteraceae bacterium]|nr:serine hydrolase domain-containing protein [Candidatus Baltobacteraceae bacterium]
MRIGIVALILAGLVMPLAALAQQPPLSTPPTAPPSAPPFSAERARAVDEMARAEIHSGSTPGVAIGIVQDGLLVYARGFGFASLRPRRAVTPSTEFYAGSLGKQFTAACVLLLEQQKKLSLDDKVTKYVPELSVAKNVTLRELLQQTSGLPRARNAAGVSRDLTRPVKIEDLIKSANAMPLEFAPGTQFDDNNLNYLLAGLIVQRVSGLPLSIFYSTQIFAPLIMTSSFLAGDQGISSAHAAGYSRERGKFTRVRPWDASWLFGSSDLVTTVQDLAKWDIGLPLLLDVDSIRDMWTPSGLQGTVPYGMGWVVDQRGGQRYVWQNGQIAGYHAMNAMLPDEHLAVIVLTNADSLNGATTVQPERLANRILDVISPLPPAHFGNLITTRATEWLGRLARIDVDRTQLTTAFSQYLSDQVVHRADVASLGPVLSLVPFESYQRSGDTVYVFDVKFRRGAYRFNFALAPDGKIDGLFLQPYG